MSLLQKQILFCGNIGKLINFIFTLPGYAATISECKRTPEQQLLYFEGYSIQKIGSNLHFVKSERKTKTLKSKHLDKLAIDLNIFVDGIYTTEKSKLQKIGDFWESLNTDNSWGGNWQTFLDTPHFQMGK